MNRLQATMLVSVIAAGFLASVSLANAAPIGPSTVIGIDFGTADGSATNWNPLTSSGDGVAAGDLTDTAGVIVDGVSFTTNDIGAGGAGSAVSSSYPSIPDAAQEDWWYEFVSTGSQQYVFTFSGLDDSLTYKLIIGSYAPGGSPGAQENRNTRWVVDSQIGDTDADSLVASYVTFTGSLTDGSGNLVISSADLNGNTASVVSALQLSVVPEPSTLAMLGLGFLGMLLLCRRHFRR